MANFRKSCGLAAVVCLCLVLLSGCRQGSIGIIGGADGPTQILISETKEDGQMQDMQFQMISQEEAKRIMDSGESCVILDVREQEEYDEGHIPGAILMPHTRTEELAPELLPDQDALILVYCRSGRRSKIAAAALAQMGYTDVREFGGILEWPYAVE